MAYTLKQLTMAWTAVHNGVAPDAAATASLNTFVNLGFSDANALSQVLNDADKTTAVAVLTYQFFTGKSPTKAGLDYLLNSSANPNDLNDAYYAKFNLENRFMNFAANLGVNGEGATAFAAKYGAMGFSDYVASIYETVIGGTYAKAAGVDVAAAVAYLVGTKDAVLATVTSAGMITPNMTPAQVDIALKAAMAGLVMAAAIKADIGLYAGAADNFMLSLATGKAIYNTDITKAYAPHKGAGSEGLGRAVDNAPPLPGGTEPPKDPDTPPASQSLVLTPGQDKLTGDIQDDTFTATHLTFDASDILDGVDGRDTLNLTAATGNVYTLPAATVTGIEVANLVNNGGLTVDTIDWTDLIALRVTSAGYTDISSDIFTDITATVSNLDIDDVSIAGGRNISLTVTGATEGYINVLAVGDITVSREVLGAANAGEITILGGKTIDVTLTSTLPVATQVQDLGGVLIAGYLDTQSIKVTAPKSLADNGAHGEIIAPTIAIQDFFYGSVDYRGTIKTVELDGFDGAGLGFAGTALSTLKVSHGSDIYIDNGGLSVTDATVLNATLNDIHGLFDDEGAYQTLHITQGPEDSVIDLGMDGLKTLTIDGVGKITVIADPLYSPNIETVTVTGAVGLEADLSGLTHLTSVDTSGTTGDNAVAIDASLAAFTGGVGDDRVALASNVPTKTIAGGLGTDTLTLDAAFADANAAAIASKVSGFERLVITGASNQTVALNTLGFHHVTTSGGAGLTLTGLTSGDTLVLNDAGTSYTATGGFGGGGDSLHIVLEDRAGAGVAFGDLATTGVETFDITTLDSSATPTGTMEAFGLTDAAVQHIVIDGNAGLTLSAAGAALNTIDASGITLGGLDLTLNGAAAAVTIHGSATADNRLDASALGANVVTYVGGSGDDTVILGKAAHSIDLSQGGDDTVQIVAVDTNSGTVFTSVTGLGADDKLSFATLSNAGAMGAKIGGPTTLAAYLDVAAQSVAGTTNTLHWFELGGDIYVVSDVSNATTFVQGADTVVRLVGLAGLLNVGNASVAGGEIIFH